MHNAPYERKNPVTRLTQRAVVIGLRGVAVVGLSAALAASRTRQHAIKYTNKLSRSSTSLSRRLKHTIYRNHS